MCFTSIPVRAKCVHQKNLLAGPGLTMPSPCLPFPLAFSPPKVDALVSPLGAGPRQFPLPLRELQSRVDGRVLAWRRPLPCRRRPRLRPLLLAFVHSLPTGETRLYTLVVTGRVADLGEGLVHFLEEAILRSRRQLHKVRTDNPCVLRAYIGMLLVEIRGQGRTGTSLRRQEGRRPVEVFVVDESLTVVLPPVFICLLFVGGERVLKTSSHIPSLTFGDSFKNLS